jgi:hypothetical protein
MHKNDFQLIIKIENNLHTNSEENYSIFDKIKCVNYNNSH